VVPATFFAEAKLRTDLRIDSMRHDGSFSRLGVPFLIDRGKLSGSGEGFSMANSLSVVGWPSRDVPAAQVVDYAVHALGSGLEPMSVEIPYPEDFSAELRCVMLGGVTIAHGIGQNLRCLHG
jgi:hypothetical protein